MNVPRRQVSRAKVRAVRKLRESVALIGRSVSLADQRISLVCIGLDVACARCDGVAETDIRQIVGPWWPALLAMGGGA